MRLPRPFKLRSRQPRRCPAPRPAPAGRRPPNPAAAKPPCGAPRLGDALFPRGLALRRASRSRYGFFIEITGAAHLFGGEAGLLLGSRGIRLEDFGLPARPAIAATPGMAIRPRRFSPETRPHPADRRGSPRPRTICRQALRPLRGTARTLRRLGFKRIGALIGQAPRAFRGAPSSGAARASRSGARP